MPWTRFRKLLTGLSARSRLMMTLARRAPTVPAGSTDLFALSAEDQRAYVAAKIRR